MGLKDLFRPKAKSLVGVDIGSSAIKVVSLKRSNGGRYQIEAMGKTDLPSDTIVDGAIISKLPLAEAIEKIFSNQKIKQNQVATSISGHSVIVKKVALPGLSEDELDESIQWEAEQYIPFDLGEVNVDYQIIRRIEEEDKIEVILVAAKKEKIADYTGVISMAGKVPTIVDIDAFALQNVYEINYEPDDDTVAALLNIGANSINIGIVKGSEFLFTRDIATGGSQYTDFLQRELGLTLEQAEQYKMGEHVPEDIEFRIPNILRSVSENVTIEIEKTFDYFKTTTYSEDIDQLYVCGGASKTAGLMDYLADNFQFPVEYLDPFQRISLDPRTAILDDNENSGADYAVAVGLALRTA